MPIRTPTSEFQVRAARSTVCDAGTTFRASASCRIALFRSDYLGDQPRAAGWSRFASAVDEYRIAGSHQAIVTRHVAVLASLMRPYLEHPETERQMQGRAGQRGTTNPGRRVRAGAVTPRVTMVIDCGVAAKFQSNVSSGAAGVADRKRASRPRHTIVASVARDRCPTWLNRASFRVVAALAVFVSLVAGCATTNDIDKYEAPEANFPARHTYGWKPGEVSTPGQQNAGDVQRLDQAVQAAIEDELAHKGYTKVDAAKADMIVSYQVAGHRTYVVSDDRRVGAPSPNEVLMPGNSPQLPPTSVVPHEQTSGKAR
jgi:hypothetical protein